MPAVDTLIDSLPTDFNQAGPHALVAVYVIDGYQGNAEGGVSVSSSTHDEGR